MKVLLINPGLGKDSESPPLNLALLGACLEAENYEVQICDRLIGQDLPRAIQTFSPDAVGVTGTSNVILDSYACADYTRSLGIYTVMGGRHSSVMPEEALQHSDCVVVGEGEIVLPKILKERPRGIVQGIPVKDLDTLPLPAYHLLDMNYYSSLQLRQEMSFASIGPKWYRLGCILTSRGCPFDCLFCLPGTSKILMVGLYWKNLKDVIEGDEVIGVVKSKAGRWVLSKSKVLKTFHRRDVLYEIRTKDGCAYSTLEHPWLMKTKWKSIKDIQENLRFGGKLISSRNVLRKVSPPTDAPVENSDYMKGYLAGSLAGDGSTGHYPFINNQGNPGINHQYKLVGDYEMLDTAFDFCHRLGLNNVRHAKFNGGKIYYNCNRCIRTGKREEVFLLESFLIENESISYKKGFIAGVYDAEGGCGGSILRIFNKNPDLLSRIAGYLDSFGFKWIRESSGVRILGGISENIRFMATFNPRVPHKKSKLIGKQLKCSSKIESITKLGMSEVHNLETSTGNFIADGFVTHNCYNSYRSLPFRFSSPEKVMEEIEFLVDHYDVRSIFFVEDNLFANQKRVREICRLLTDSGLDIIWGANARVDCINKDILRTVKRAGCKQVTFGWESASQRILDVLNKRTTVELNEKSIDLCNEALINASGTVMVGNPTETLEDLKMTYRFIEENYITGGIGVCITTPYPGTKLWDWCKERELIKEPIDWNIFDFRHIPVRMHDIPDQIFQTTVGEMVKMAISKFQETKDERLRR